MDLKAEALMAAQRSGFDVRRLAFSSRLEWTSDRGRLALRKARVERGKITLYIEAMRARWDDDEIVPKAIAVLGEAIESLKRRAPQTLYVHRALTNADDLIAWAKASGFKTTIVAKEMHVTLAYSKTPLDWDKLEPLDDEVVVTGGARGVEQLGEEGAVVLRFRSAELSKRWQDICDAGAEWGYEDYKPHVTITYDGGSVDLKRVEPFSGPLVFGPEVFAKITPYEGTERAFDESEHPRDEDGKFTFSGGGASAQPTQEEIDEALAAREEDLHPEVIDVGGDEWNQATALRLEREYVAVRPELEAIVAGAAEGVPVSEDDEEPEAPFVPDEWDSMTTYMQESAFEAYKSQTHQSYLESEIDNWWNGDDPPLMAMQKVAENFNADPKSSTYDALWAHDAIKEYIEESEERIPFTAVQLTEALTIKYEQNYSSNPIKDVTFEFDYDKLKPDSDLYDPDQPMMPGIKPPTFEMPSKLRGELEDVLSDAMQKQAESIQSDLEPPEYLSEGVSDYQADSWDQMDSDDKFKWTKDNTDILSELEAAAETTSLEMTGLPDEYDPLQQSGSLFDYKRTQAVARYLSNERALNVIKDRGLSSLHNGAIRAEVAQLDRSLWEDWKGSSYSGEHAQLLQIATAEELGGRLRLKAGPGDSTIFNRDALVKQADRDYRGIGGYAGVKAYVRAKWETTQFLLDKAGAQTLTLYRGLTNREAVESGLEYVNPSSSATQAWPKLANAQIERNGLISTSTSIIVANDWKKGATDKLTMRFEVPRTAVMSVPAYGINVHTEREVVLAGTAYKNWDAWLGKAPDPDTIPLKDKA